MGICRCCSSKKIEDEAAGDRSQTAVTPWSKRGCTDVICLVLFIAAWVVYAIVTVVGVQDGNPVKLYKPRDFSGAYCGMEMNWNSGPNLQGKDSSSFTMNVSAMSDQIANQLLCSSATSAFLLGSSSPLTASEKDAYSCGCCLRPCMRCVGSLNLGKGGDLTSSSVLSSTITSRMSELTRLYDNGAAFFDPAGWNGDFAANMWSTATQYLTQVCLPTCNTDYTLIANSTSTRSYTYTPAADNPLRPAWDKLRVSTDAGARDIRSLIETQFTFKALPASVCPYSAVHCVPFPGMTFTELYGGFCGFDFSAAVIQTVGQAAADAFSGLGGNDFADLSTSTLGTWLGDFEKSIDTFVVVAVLAFIAGIIFLVLLRFFVGACVWTSIVLVLLLFVVGGFFVWVRSGQCQGADLFESGAQMVVAITVAGTTAVDNAVNGNTAASEALTGNGVDYVGSQSRTRSGYACKNWDQVGDPYWPAMQASGNLRQNFCRNPYNASDIFQAPTIWCFTTDPQKKWELCAPIGVIQPACKQGYVVTDKSAREWLKAGAIALWTLSFIWLLLICCFRSRIALAIALNKVGATFLGQAPQVVLIPVVQAFIGWVWALVWVFSVCFLISQVPASYTPTEAYATYEEAFGTETTPGKCTDKWPTGFVYRDESCTVTDPRCWRCGPPRFIFDVRFFVSAFVYLWNNAFIIALGQCCIAGAVGVWFFTPNANKGKVACVRQAVYNCLRYHTGSLAFGALILAVVQLARWVLMYFEMQAKAYKNKFMQCLLRVLQYALWCLEKFIKFLDKNAYIQIALRGTSFCTSAKKAWEIIEKNILRFGVVATLGRVIHYIGTLVVMGGTATGGYFLLQAMHKEVNPVVPVILYTIVGYLVGKLYMSVFGMSVDTCLQCVIQAEEISHDGSFVPSALASILRASRADASPTQIVPVKPKAYVA